jgi:phosphodiesterase/alkaline phosphatase D-like protein
MKQFTLAAVLLLCAGFATAQTKHNQQEKPQDYGINQQGKQKITNGPVVEYTSDHSAMIAWSTKDSSGTYIAYGTNQNNLSQRSEKAWGGTNHRLELKNLQPGTKYYFQVRSEDAKGAGAYGADVESPVVSFTTQARGQAADRDNRNVGVNGAPVSTPQGISNAPAPAMASGPVTITRGPVIENLTDHNAIIAWTTDKPLDMGIHYGTTPSSLTQVNSQAADAADNSGGTNHRATISNLQPNTAYYFIATTNTGQQVGNLYVFQTVAQGQPAKHQINLGK